MDPLKLTDFDTVKHYKEEYGSVENLIIQAKSGNTKAKRWLEKASANSDVKASQVRNQHYTRICDGGTQTAS